jgi:hypothetical protein
MFPQVNINRVRTTVRSSNIVTFSIEINIHIWGLRSPQHNFKSKQIKFLTNEVCFSFLDGMSSLKSEF